MLLGRGAERARIDALLDDARAGRSAALVLRGEPGVGKSALMGYAAERAEGFRVLGAIGVESESELPFSGIHELLLPLLPRVDALPAMQAAALRTALASGASGEVDRFAVSIGVASLLVEGSQDQPLLCLVDDLQWIDQASAAALRFASRRLAANPVAMLLAVRTGEPTAFETPELPSIGLRGIHREAAQALLASTGGHLSPEMAERVLEVAEGNPLALLEIPAALQEEAEAALDAPLPIGARLERSFARRAQALGDASRLALLVAAASDTGELRVIGPALSELGTSTAALEPAEGAGLVRIGTGDVRFRHPLVRSAIYQAASATERRGAHRALAHAHDATAEGDRSAWHLAAAATGPDERVALALESTAADARRRGGLAAAARALERSAALTPDPRRRSRRLVAAAQAARLAGKASQAGELVEAALAQPHDEHTWATGQALLADIHYWNGGTDDVLQIAAAADRLINADRISAAAVLVTAAMACGPTDPEQALALTQRALDARPADLSAQVVKLNYLLRLGRAGDAEHEALAVAEAAGRAHDWESTSEVAVVLGVFERYAEARALAAISVAEFRGVGALKQLSHALCAQVQIESRGGDLRTGYEAGVTSLDLAQDLGEPLQVAFSASFLAACEAWLGLEATRHHAAQAIDAVPAPTSRTTLEARAAIGLLELQLGSHEKAVIELEAVVRSLRSLGILEPGYVQAMPELVEALARSRRRRDAEQALEELETQARATNRRWALAAAARCRGLLASDSEVDGHFHEALEWHARADRPLEQARTELAYGERLRRAGRRKEARAQLRAALATFERAGARLFAERARRELGASGERLRKTDHVPEELSPQELQVAFVVTRGVTNKEAAAELFLSPKTIEFHLRNAFRKLGVRSRTELANALRGPQDLR